MGFFACSVISCSYPIKPFNNVIAKTCQYPQWGKSFLQKPTIFGPLKSSPGPKLVATAVEEIEIDKGEEEEERPRLRWIEIGPDITDAQKHTISQLPPKMTKRCKALMKQIICFSPQETNLSLLLAAWVKIMKPRRADWLSVLKELRTLEHPLLFEVAELALPEESFEANIRDYTKIIDGYGKQNRLQDAENIFLTMKKRGFTCDQITLTALVHMYSKAGNLKRAEETFEEMKLLGLPLDKRAYGSIIMAYVRAGMAGRGENLLREMEVEQIYAGREVYKALLRAYSTIGDTKGAQRVFDAIQFAGITPDVKLCALLMNAYGVAGQSDMARCVFENLRRAGLEPSDKCVAVMLAAYEKDNKLDKALNFLMNLERDGVMVGKEASDVLVGWFRKLGVVGEVEAVLREFASREFKHRVPAF